LVEDTFFRFGCAAAGGAIVLWYGLPWDCVAWAGGVG